MNLFMDEIFIVILFADFPAFFIYSLDFKA